jgi:hypothetical protein
MLYIVPKNPPSEEPIIDELTMKMVASLRKATLPHYQYLGFHTCVCGARSDSTDFILPNGLRTNSLCVHYLAYHRAEIEDGELWAVEGLSDGCEYPDSDELHGGGWPLRDRHGRQVEATKEIHRRRERYDARERDAPLSRRLVRMLWRFGARTWGKVRRRRRPPS